MSRRELLLGAAAAAVTARGLAAQQSPIDDDHPEDSSQRQTAWNNRSLSAAAEYLWSMQGEDGGWHSPQYGVLRSGQALTPFVLDALLAVPESTFARPQGGVDRALAFIVAHVDEAGCIGRNDPEVWSIRCTARRTPCDA